MKHRHQRFEVYVCLFILVLASLWLVKGVHALGSGSRIEGGGNVVTLQKEDGGREVEIKPGDVIQIELSGSGGTGYWWYVTKIDTKYAELVSEETKVPSDKKLLGGPTKGIWRFKAKEPGKTDLIMKYYRVWEGPEKAADQFSVTLNIH